MSFLSNHKRRTSPPQIVYILDYLCDFVQSQGYINDKSLPVRPSYVTMIQPLIENVEGIFVSISRDNRQCRRRKARRRTYKASTVRP